MRWPLALLVLVLALSGCATPASSPPAPLHPSPVPATRPPTATLLPPTLTDTPLPVTPTLTATLAPLLPAPGTCPGSATLCILPWPFVFQRPLGSDASVVIDPTYLYGATQDGKREPHHGVDFPNAQGTAVLAAGDGIVVVAGDDKLALYGWVTSFYGNLVVIEHHLPGLSKTVYTLYGHLSQVTVPLGQNVHAGDKIGEVGSTGIAIGSHLHLEVRITNDDYKSTRNPQLWLTPLPGTGVLAGRVVDAQGVPVHTTLNFQQVVDGQASSLYPIETYPRESLKADDLLQENFVTGDQPAGEYRISLIYDNKLYEQTLQIQPGKLTLVIIRVQ
jgi:murein DD-endopeptidase MepM/ murein hydrolase activator NlpD